MSNIYDSANQIEREIRELPEFKALKEAYEKVQANEEAHKRRSTQTVQRLPSDANRITRKTNEWTRVQRRRCNESTRNGCENPIRRSNQ